jgi:hypothetical protein
MIVASDERWLRTLEMTIRLDGLTPILRRSFAEAEGTPVDAATPRAIIVNLNNDATPREMQAARRLQDQLGVPVIVILPEALAVHEHHFRRISLRVVTRPYPPSALYAALRGLSI